MEGFETSIGAEELNMGTKWMSLVKGYS